MIRTAEYPQDYEPVKALIKQGVEEGTLQPRDNKVIRRSIEQGRTVVADLGGEIVGTASVTVYSRRLAEIRSVYVAPQVRGNGLAGELVQGLLEQPVSILPSATVFAITTSPSTFERAGFSQAQGRRTILHKSI